MDLIFMHFLKQDNVTIVAEIGIEALLEFDRGRAKVVSSIKRSIVTVHGQRVTYSPAVI